MLKTHIAKDTERAYDTDLVGDISESQTCLHANPVVRDEPCQYSSSPNISLCPKYMLYTIKFQIW